MHEYTWATGRLHFSAMGELEPETEVEPQSAAERDDEDDWVEVRRFDDAIGATMIRDFLLDHDVRVAIRGNPQATRMTWSQTSDNIRIVVPPADLEKAREALAAMSAGDAHPFRGASPVMEDEHEEKFEKPRSGLGAAMLAFFVPIGAGHFYARHGAAGTIFAIGMIGAVLGSIAFGHPELFRAWMLLIVVDAVGAFLAVRRFNQKRVPPDAVQRQWAMAAVVAAYGLAWLLARAG
jgi:hypothetical protein